MPCEQNRAEESNLFANWKQEVGHSRHDISVKHSPSCVTDCTTILFSFYFWHTLLIGLPLLVVID